MIKKVVLILLVSMAFQLNAQKKDKVLLTIDNEEIHSSEFLRVYNKNKDVVSDENKKNITEYLDLFINYKLKLKDAKDLKMDTIPSYIKEFDKYKTQLIEPFLKDRKVTDKLVAEAYERMGKEVKASHILILVKPDATPKDTIAAYNKIVSARDLIIGGKDFVDVAKKMSQDPSAKENGGNLGYFSAFAMVYPFETAAFNTPVGEISMPFRTKFGYHILKVYDVRKSKGEVKVAHIMIRDKKTDSTYAKKQISDIYNKFLQGEKFEVLAKKHSDDKASAIKGGVIKPFTQGKMIQPFSDIAFNLQKEGDVSKPFKTKFGWHFIKLINKIPVKPFEEVKDELAKKVEKGDRSILIGKSITSKLKSKYNIAFNKEVYNKYFSDNEKDDKDKITVDETILTIENSTYSVNDLKTYLKKNNGSKTYNDFIDVQVMSYYKNNLEFENKEFGYTLQEYRDGLLLFDLLQNKIWTKAEKDTIGLQNFFDKNASKYNWKKRAKADLASCTKAEKATLVKKYMTEGKTIDQIKELVNDGATIHVIFHSGTYEVDSNKLPHNFQFVKGVQLYKNNDTDFTICNVSEIMEASPKELNDVKGKVISNYQDFLEKQWIQNLRSKYKVEVNKKVFKKLVRKNH